MIGKIAKAVLKLILPDENDHLLKVFKLDKIMNYVELENDADRKIAKLEEQMKMVAKDIHPPAIDLKEWKEFKADMKKIKKLRVFKSIG